MNDISRLLIRLAALAVVFAAANPAASAEDDAMTRCAQLESDAARLACFDAIAEERADAAPPPVEAPSPRQAPAEASPPAAAPAAAASGAASGSEYRRMTREEKRAARAREKAERKAAREYTATVTNLRRRPYGQMVVTLDNGEVWTEQYASHGFLVDVGDTVTLRKSRFSSAYRLVNEKGKGYSVTRLQ